MGRRSLPTGSPAGCLRLYLGLTQSEMALYLHVPVTTLNKVETDSQRRLPAPGRQREGRLVLLLPWTLTDLPPPPPLPTLPVATVPAHLLPPPAGAAAIKALRHAAEDAELRAFRLRQVLRKLAAQQQLLTHRQRALADLAAPPGPTIPPDDDPPRTAWLVQRLTDYVADTQAPHHPLHPAAVAHQVLRLHLLETEAATLRAWLGEAPAPGPRS